MPEIQLPIIRGDKKNQNIDYTDRLPKNMIAVAKQIRGANGYLISHDGLKRYGEAVGVDRGGFYNDRLQKHLRVSGPKLITVDTLGTVTEVGDIAGSGQASMSYSFNNQLIVAGGNAYLYNGTTLSQITDPDLGNPIDACWIDSYFFYTDGENIYHSLISDESQIDPLQFATAEFMPDKSLGVMQTPDNLVMVFGRYSIEYFVNQANPQFAFSRIAQKSMKVGIVGTHCKCELDGAVFILGGRREESPSIYVLGAGSATRLATQTVDEIIGQYTESELSTSVLESRTDERDKLLIVRLPNHTLVFNMSAAPAVGTENAWSVLSYGISDERWLGANGVFDPRIGQWIYGSSSENGLYSLDKQKGAQNNTPSMYEFFTNIVPVKNARVGNIEINTIAGFNTDLIEIFMAVSYDGVFDGTEYISVYSGPLQYGKRLVIRRAVGYVADEFSLSFRCLSKDKINVSNLVVNYV